MKRSGGVLFCTMMLFSQQTFAQDGNSSSIRVMLSAQRDSIIIRWAPDNAVAWKFLTEYGYRVERYTIVRDSLVLEEKTMKLLSQNPIKPAGQAAWMSHMNDDMIALEAQCIFGEGFEVSGSNAIFDIKNKVEELQSRFSYALFAADVSPRAASLGALRWVDHDVKKNEKYLYRIYSLVPESILKIDFGFGYIGPSEVLTLPRPRNLKASLRNNYAMIEYDANPLKKIYSAYFLERSDSTGSYKSLSEFPLLPLLTDSTGSQQLITVDSLPKNNRTYIYRVRGITPFGQLGPYSESISIRNFASITINSPVVSDLQVTTNGSVLLSWQVTSGQESHIGGFEITRASKEQGNFERINDETLGPSVRTFEDQKPLPTNYYKIVAISQNDKQKAETFPHLIQLEDSIPPIVPVGFEGQIDTASIVTLKWKANNERDLIGYRIYFSNFRNAEFAQITSHPVATPQFLDTLNSNTLSRKAYYKITAVDNRYNTSDFSDIIEIIRPDKVAPVPPVITGVRNTQVGVELKWIRSVSEDVAKHILYRRCGGSSEWAGIHTFSSNDSIYMDRGAGTSQSCDYKLVAQDQSGLLSRPTPVVAGKILTPWSNSKVEKVSAQADRINKNVRLDWDQNLKGVSKYRVFRAEGNEPITLYKTVLSGQKEFTDRQVRINTLYTYRIKAVYNDGSESAFSDKIEINY